MDRPSTSKPRGLCIYYNTPRGCFKGAQCKFLHGADEKLTLHDKHKTCKWFAAGYCKRGADCWFRHVLAPPSEEPLPVLSEDTCGICLEKPVTFGLLSNCSHVFCVDCIRGWRFRENKSEDIRLSKVNKKCPYCRSDSKMIVPSSHFYPDNHPGKAAVIKSYKASTALVKCKYFEESPEGEKFCPFGHDCLYKHENADGTPHVFPHGVDYYMARWKSRRSGSYRQSAHDDNDTLFTLDRLMRFGGLDMFFSNENVYFDAETPSVFIGNDAEVGESRLFEADTSTPDDDGEGAGELRLTDHELDELRRLSDAIGTTLDVQAPNLPSMVPAADDGSITFTFNSFRPYDLLYPPRPISASGMSAVPVLGAATDPPASDAEDAVNEDPSLVPNTATLATDYVADVFEDNTTWDLPRTITDNDGTAERNDEVPDDAHLALHRDEGASDLTSPVPPDDPAPVHSDSAVEDPSMIVAVAQEEATEGALLHTIPTPEPSSESDPNPSPFPEIEQDAEPPFMTDGRGRVVWSHANAKQGAPTTTGRSRRRTEGTDRIDSGEREVVQGTK